MSVSWPLVPLIVLTFLVAGICIGLSKQTGNASEYPADEHLMAELDVIFDFCQSGTLLDYPVDDKTFRSLSSASNPYDQDDGSSK